MWQNNFKTRMSDDNLRKRSQLRYKYNRLLSQKVRFMLFRARQRFFEKGDKAGHMLANYIKQQEALNAIATVQDQQGVLGSSMRRSIRQNLGQGRQRLRHLFVT